MTVYRVDIDCSWFPGNNKAGDTVRESVEPGARRCTATRRDGHEQAQEQRGSSDRKLSIATGPIASASPLIKSSPVIQEGRPFAERTSRLCTPLPAAGGGSSFIAFRCRWQTR